MSEPISTDLGRPERLHPLFLATGLGGSLRGLAGGYAFIAYLFVSGQLRTAALAAATLAALMVVGVFLYWRNFEFWVGASEIRIDSGILNRTHRSIPFDRIQDVDISQGPVARLLGLAAVRFETGASSGSKADEGVLHAIPLERAEDLRTLIRAGRPQGAFVSAAGNASPPIYAMDLKRLSLAGLFNFSLAIFAGLFGLTQTFGDVLGFDPLNQQFWRDLLASSGPLAAFAMSHRAAAIVMGLILLLVAGAATGMVRTFLRDYGFRLDRTETSLRRRRGLLTKTDVSLPVRRVQAAVVATGPVRDRFGWRELKLQNLAQDEGSGDHIVAPLATPEEIGGIVAVLGWRPLGDDVEWRRVSAAHVWILALALAPLLFIFGAQAAFFAFVPAFVDGGIRGPVAAALLPASLPFLLIFGGLLAVVLARFLAWRRTAYALDGDRLLVRTGWWRRRLTILPIARIQSLDIRESLVSRWLGVATLALGVAGGGGSAHSVPAVPRERARALRDQLLGSVA